MSEERRDKERDDGEVIYRRLAMPQSETERRGANKGGELGASPVEGRIAPTLMPLLIGFAILLVLVFLIGYLSGRKLDEVSSTVLDLEQQQAAKSNFALQLLVAAIKLNNEARARARVRSDREARGEEVKPLFNLPLRTARNELNELLPRLEQPPYSEIEKWRALRNDLITFSKTTEDLDTYALNGFVSFRKVNGELSDLLTELQREQAVLYEKRTELNNAATRRVYLLTFSALLFGALVAAGTIWEVQRRFRQMRRSMKEARRERQFSAQMLEGMVSAVAAIDARDHIRSANDAFLKIFPEAIIGESVHKKFASPEAAKMLEAVIASRVERSTYRGRWMLDAANAASDGEKRTFDVYSSPLEIDGERGQVITLVDVTEAVEAETVLRRNESLTAVGQAAAQVAHEIKNPLGSIRLGVSMLRDMTADQEALSTIDLVERGIDHLNKLAGDVTQFSQHKSLALSEVDLRDLLDKSLELVANKLQEKNTPVEKQFSRESLRGRWDADQLRQVFVNLLANAIDASEQNAPLTISTGRTIITDRGRTNRGNGDRTLVPGSHEYARVMISDQGVGMDEETRAHIFEPFFTTKKRGTGLGLSIVKQIIEQHGGTIAVASAPGKGTRFTIDLPLQEQ